MNEIQKIDEYLLKNIFQKGSNWFQDCTGENCFFLAKVTMALHCVGAGIWHVFIDAEGSSSNPVREFFGGLIITLSIDVFLYIGTKSRRNIKIGFRNPLEHVWVWFRCYLIVVYTILFVIFVCQPRNPDTVVLRICVDILQMSYVYLLSCTPKPPSYQHRTSPSSPTT